MAHSHHFENKTLPFIPFKILCKHKIKNTEISNKTNIIPKTVYLCTTVWRCLHDPMFSHFIINVCIIPTSERQIDRLTQDDSITEGT